MERFRFSPGLMGPGMVGKDGSDGLPGLGVMFTDLDPIEDADVINDKINNNQVLWSGDSAPLPAGREYQVGDTFVDKDGFINEITLGGTVNYVEKALMSTTDIFSYYGVDSDYFVSRWSNIPVILSTIDNSTQLILTIDSINPTDVVDYTAKPFRIYGVKPINFTRIEYCDKITNGYIPFSTYFASSSSINSGIAIVKNTADDSFHIGNLNDDQITPRPVDLMFDGTNVKVSRQSNNLFTESTDNGAVSGYATIITNTEISTNNLFTGVFDKNPASFSMQQWPVGSGNVKVYWNKLAMMGTNDASVDLHFYKKQSPYTGKTFSFFDSTIQPLVFSNLNSAGDVSISNLSTGEYNAFLEATFAGVSRRTLIKTITVT